MATCLHHHHNHHRRPRHYHHHHHLTLDNTETRCTAAKNTRSFYATEKLKQDIFNIRISATSTLLRYFLNPTNIPVKSDTLQGTYFVSLYYLFLF